MTTIIVDARPIPLGDIQALRPAFDLAGIAATDYYTACVLAGPSRVRGLRCTLRDGTEVVGRSLDEWSAAARDPSAVGLMGGWEYLARP